MTLQTNTCYQLVCYGILKRCKGTDPSLLRDRRRGRLGLRRNRCQGRGTQVLHRNQQFPSKVQKDFARWLSGDYTQNTHLVDKRKGNSVKGKSQKFVKNECIRILIFLSQCEMGEPNQYGIYRYMQTRIKASKQKSQMFTFLLSFLSVCNFYLKRYSK